MARLEDLRHTLHRIDRRGYPAYKDIAGAYDMGAFTLFLDHIQGDPFAAPSKVRVRVPMTVAQIPKELFHNKIRRIAMQDFLARQFARNLHQGGGRRRGSGKSGLITIDAGGQAVLERTAVLITEDWLEARLSVGLPAAGRSVLGREAEAMLCQDLPLLVDAAARWSSLNQDQARRFVEQIENQEHLREQLETRGLIAFIADGSILPRESGVSQRPMPAKQATPFKSPPEMSVVLELLNPQPGADGAGKQVTGMGIPKGVTLIAGGGYHGKSTLLDALEHCVYPHIPGDGRELVVVNPNMMKVRAEDGRRVANIDISAFIANLPHGRSTTSFHSEDASGSTSQAANIIEAIEAGASGLLLDEDTCATNFMLRDARMQALVNKEHEPITPLLERVRSLYEDHDLSSILVMGGCGDYLDVADKVIVMRAFQPFDATTEARQITAAITATRKNEAGGPMTGVRHRIPLSKGIDASRGRREVKIDGRGLEEIVFGESVIDLRYVEQLVDPSQTRAIGYAIHLAATRWMGADRSLREILDALDHFFDREGLDALDPFRRGERHPGNFARPRTLEIAAAINRLRTVQMKQRD